MNVVRLRGAVSISIALALLSGSLFVTHARGSERTRVASHALDEGRELRNFWTRDRMRNAPPLMLTMERATRAVDGWTAARGIAGSDLLADQEAPFTRREISDPSEFPYRLHGKLFVRAGRLEYHCSATALDSANESVVFTAGHCLYGEEIGGWVDSAVFVPGYRFGNRPYGTWLARSAHVTPGWQSTESARSDVGALVMEPLDGSTLEDAIGGRSIAFGQPREQSFEVFGYPAADGFDGERLYVCEADTYWRDSTPSGTGPDPIGLGCDMTQGSSGGGWVINGTTLNSVNSYGYEDRNGSDLPYMFGPYFASAASDLFTLVDSVPVAVPEPLPSVSESPDVPVPATSPAPTPTETPVPIAVSTIADRDDSRSPLDIARVDVSRGSGGVQVELRTHDAWALRLLSDAYPRNFIFLDFDTVGGSQLDYYLALFSRNGRLVGKVLQYARGDDVAVGNAEVRRTSRRGLSASISGSVLPAESKLRWVASSFFKTRHRCATGCRDLAPNRGLAEL